MYIFQFLLVFYLAMRIYAEGVTKPYYAPTNACRKRSINSYIEVIAKVTPTTSVWNFEWKINDIEVGKVFINSTADVFFKETSSKYSGRVHVRNSVLKLSNVKEEFSSFLKLSKLKQKESCFKFQTQDKQNKYSTEEVCFDITGCTVTSNLISGNCFHDPCTYNSTATLYCGQGYKNATIKTFCGVCATFNELPPCSETLPLPIILGLVFIVLVLHLTGLAEIVTWYRRKKQHRKKLPTWAHALIVVGFLIVPLGLMFIFYWEYIRKTDGTEGKWRFFSYLSFRKGTAKETQSKPAK